MLSGAMTINGFTGHLPSLLQNRAEEAFQQLWDRNPFNDPRARRQLMHVARQLSPRQMHQAYQQAAQQANCANRMTPGFWNDPFPRAPGRFSNIFDGGICRFPSPFPFGFDPFVIGQGCFPRFC